MISAGTLLLTLLPGAGALLALPPGAGAVAAPVATSLAAAQTGEWRSYGADRYNTKYSGLAQINKTNVAKLRVSWRWSSPDNDIKKKRKGLRLWLNEATPVMAAGVLYTSTALSQVAAIEAAGGKTLWVYNPRSYESGNPPNHGFVHRGVVYWAAGSDRRVLIATADAYLIALDARTGKPVPGFGENGRVDLTRGLRRPVERSLYTVTSPPVICRNVIVVGSSIADDSPRGDPPPGDVRGFDARTGRQMWVFQSIPQRGEFGNETWQRDSWKNAGNTNAWAAMSADEELGYVYVPFGGATNDWHGERRPGNNLFAESLVCLNATTGKRVWHFQVVHHGLWDYDLPAAPNLLDINIAGRRVRAVAQVTKQGFCFAFNRVTGVPIWPIEERAVPQSQLPGEQTSPTQPFPAKPPPFDHQGIRMEDLIDFNPELRRQAIEALRNIGYGPLYSPPSEKPALQVPGTVGGASWAGAAVDPATALLYVTSATEPMSINLVRQGAGYRYAVNLAPAPVVQGLPLLKPPYGRVTAINMNSGEHAWMAPVGSGPRDHPLLKTMQLPPLGWPVRGFPLVTKTLLFVAQEGMGYRMPAGQPKKLYAFDKTTGHPLAEVALPEFVNGAPMTYMAKGKQYIVLPVGGLFWPAELVALSLP